jgi:hypothetical protein
VRNIAQLLAESGETVHVIGQLSERAPRVVEEEWQGRLIIHRIPLDDWTALWGTKPNPALQSREALGLFHSNFYPQFFSYEACMLAEKLIVEEGIDVIEGQAILFAATTGTGAWAEAASAPFSTSAFANRDLGKT